jgi:curved DNA-binding protein
MEYKDYYQILGVKRDATQDEIKKAYRKLAAKLHPDKNQGDETANKKFTDLGEAYEVLKDPEKRKLYNRVGKDWKQYERAGGNASGFDFNQYGFSGQGAPGGQRVHFEGDIGDMFGGGGFSDFFQSIFGGGFQSQAGGNPFAGRTGQQRQQRTHKGVDVQAELQISLDEAWLGASKTVQIGGDSVNIKIPAGITDGKKLKLKGRGQKSPYGGATGDLLLTIRVRPQPEIEIKGLDVHLVQAVDLFTVVLGGSITIKTPSNQMRIKISPNTPNGKLLKLAGHGYPDFSNPEKKGDLFVKLLVTIPNDFSDEELEQLREMASKRGKG